ncbi:MAG: VWA domain-containing protein [Methylomicrobium sp.]|nr:VWA domain-containing protein [Methylomicrobium sp.]
MIKIKKILLATIFPIAIALSACAEQPIRTFRPIKTIELDHLIQNHGYRQKADHVYVLLDSSSSMKEAYHGNADQDNDFPGDASPTKFSVARELLFRINNSIEGLDINVALRRFGFGPCLDWRLSRLDYPLEPHDYDRWLSSLGQQECVSGGATLTNALEEVVADLSSISGKTALLIISDGSGYITSPVTLAKVLKARYGDSICIYTVWTGNSSDIPGQSMLNKLADIGGCGFYTTSRTIYPATGFDAFIASVVLHENQYETE